MRVLKLISGKNNVEINTFGATVTSWINNGKEQLFLSSKAKVDGSKAIRGGIPIVFPNFGPWKLGPQHGFARITDWEVMKEDDDCAILKMENNEKTEKMWNFKFSLQYTVRIENNKLFTILTVHNTDDKEFDFTALLHTYFHVDVPSLEVEGFFGMKFTDSLSGNDHEESEKVAKVEKNIDRIYKNVERSQVIKSKMGAVELHKTGLPDVVFWNPWEQKAQEMSDFDNEGYLKMICVEPGYVSERKFLKPDEQWTGSQWIKVIS